MSHKVHSALHVVFARKVHVAAAYLGLTFEKVVIGYDQTKTPEYLKKNPNGKFPVLETPEGKFLFESNAILRYVARLDKSKGLYGSDLLEEALVDQWLDWFSGEVLGSLFGALGPYFGWQGTKETVKAAEQKLRPLLKILDDHLKTHTFIVGNKVTIADINAASHLVWPFKFCWDEKFRKSIPNVNRWFETLIGQEPFTKEFGRPIFCQKALEFPTVSAPAPKEETKKEDKKEQPKTEKKDEKKAEPKAAAKKKDDDEEEESAEKKEKNPLDALPPTTFNLFDFKTLFVNAANKQEALDFFWKNYDAAGYSIWFIEYEKAEGEGKVLFLTNNLMNGFIQRLDHFRKYAFGVHGVYGEEPNLEIRGIWLWRGTEIAQEVKDLDSFDYHKFTKLDTTNDAHKKKVNEYWLGLNEEVDVVEGLKARTVKYFK
jgi:elongation factor 1-gamma